MNRSARKRSIDNTIDVALLVVHVDGSGGIRLISVRTIIRIIYFRQEINGNEEDNEMDKAVPVMAEIGVRGP